MARRVKTQIFTREPIGTRAYMRSYQALVPPPGFKPKSSKRQQKCLTVKKEQRNQKKRWISMVLHWLAQICGYASNQEVMIQFAMCWQERLKPLYKQDNVEQLYRELYGFFCPLEAILSRPVTVPHVQKLRTRQLQELKELPEVHQQRTEDLAWNFDFVDVLIQRVIPNRKLGASSASAVGASPCTSS